MPKRVYEPFAQQGTMYFIFRLCTKEEDEFLVDRYCVEPGKGFFSCDIHPHCAKEEKLGVSGKITVPRLSGGREAWRET